MALLQCRDLNFSYPEMTDSRSGFALSGINFSVDSGETLLLYGRSGSGKSTLLRLFKPELAPFGEKSGEILFEGKPLSRLEPRGSAARIGYVGQDPEAMPVTEKTLSELAFLPQNLGLPQHDIYRRIAEISAFFGLEEMIDKPLCELSGGQKQLVNLAAVMVGAPKLLLLDEPTAQLDPLAAEQFWQTVRRIREELGTATVICEHRTEHFFGDCDGILYLENGAQKFVLPPDDAAKSLGGSPMLGGFPCAVQLSAAVKCDDRRLVSVSDGMRFVRERYGGLRKATVYAVGKSGEKSENQTAVSAKNLAFRYDRYGKNVIEGLDIEAHFGRITALCGANGTGKSTLLKLLAGAFSPQEGKIFIGGKRISAYKNGSLYRNMLAMLPQNPLDILIEETVLHELSRSADGEKYSQEEIESVTERLQIGEDLLGSHPFDLSGGEVQRVALAKLLLTKPRILLLDEPTKGLDPVCKAQVSAILRSLAEQGAAVIFVTHDLEFAAQTADDIALIFGGRAVTHEPTEDFLRKNSVYTTAAARIGRAVFPNAVSAERLTAACTAAEKERAEHGG